MLERIKQFYMEHEHIVLTSALAVGAAVGTAFAIAKIVDGKTIVTASKRDYEDGAMEVLFCMKNGDKRYFVWEADGK